MSNSNYGILHNHSEYSIRDSAMSIRRMFERARELGATAISLTDHGNLVGFFDFMKTGKEFGIKPIPGIEAYYLADAVNLPKSHQHLILMAKDLTGLKAIWDANYRSYSNLYEGMPRMDHNILAECFGPGSAGHGHVIATSACIAGVLCQILMSDDTLAREAEKITEKRDKYHPIDNEFLDKLKAEEDLAAEIDALIKKRDEVTELSKLSVAGLNRRLKTLDANSDEAKNLQAEIDEKTRIKTEAKQELADIKHEIASKKRKKTEYSTSIKTMKESVTKWSMYDDKVQEILSRSIGETRLYEMTKEACTDFVNIFGAGNFFVELQYHHITQEARYMPILAKLAKEIGVPVVAANDAHYATNSHDDIRARTLVAAMRFNDQVDEAVEGFGELYMKTEDELRTTLLEILDEDTVNQAIANISVITDACNVEWEHGEHYPVFVGGKPGESAAQRLRRLAVEGIKKRYPGSQWKPEYEQRMEYELNIIEKMGYSDYLCIVQDFLEYGRSLAYECPEKIGYSIGPGRGSAVGSIVCYLSGITSVDPMKYGLLFERFLNPERVSMPDIDSDLSGEVRDKVIDYVRKKYSSSDPKVRKNGTPICGIITKGTLAGKAAIRGAGRVTDIPASVVDELARAVPNEPGAKIADIPDLENRCENAVVAQLVNDAKLVEGVTVNYGVHAAGIIIADNGNVGEYVPLMYNDSKSQWVTQCDMGQCEGDAGLLKMDFLGLKNLDIITSTLRRIYNNYGIRIEMEQVPLESEVFANIFATGNTNSVFQFESNGMKDMLRQFQPSSMEDIILLVAAYRPGPMQFIPDIIKTKHGKLTPHYIADGLKEILAPTYGVPIYQEQVCETFVA